ncbi:alpha-E domain-containing protein [Caulobacter mirabilis]|uniref:DUF403 domain-containing protein n=1 Tax=Caulobacter mirabilis TaxID=69666 RepID=A0A2D2AZH4_9CAUL|nr:alpha-E domain-containing protein [Caulobacter mirabilis]ATQ43408.1 hypothetical protein CSW64_13790 [Caulobacter mirabilis]
MMLARVADSLYWMGRYIERAEHVARLADIMLTATLDRAVDAGRTQEIAVAAAGETPPAPGALPMQAARRLVFDRSSAGGVLSSLARARENARQVRDQITTETWERLNLLYLKVTGETAVDLFDMGASAFLHDVIADLHLFRGAADATMSHGEGFRFLMLGVYLERANLIAQLLEVCFGDGRGARSSDHVAEMNLLRMACALEPYLRRYTAEIEPRLILEFLLFDEEFPRSIRFATARIEENLGGISRLARGGGLTAPDRLAGRLKARLEFADMEELRAMDASALLTDVVADCARIHDAVHDAYVAYSLETRLPA